MASAARERYLHALVHKEGDSVHRERSRKACAEPLVEEADAFLSMECAHNMGDGALVCRSLKRLRLDVCLHRVERVGQGPGHRARDPSREQHPGVSAKSGREERQRLLQALENGEVEARGRAIPDHADKAAAVQRRWPVRPEDGTRAVEGAAIPALVAGCVINLELALHHVKRDQGSHREEAGEGARDKSAPRVVEFETVHEACAVVVAAEDNGVEHEAVQRRRQRAAKEAEHTFLPYRLPEAVKRPRVHRA
mmetsp:Transcript_4296/g.12139  ORF Transcript_4296/g.12139 Transcript_4296/m.12139 type:complete len:252 (-) Transcript_4296:127-882(-)|eukprot:CAMPEP_0185176300 /NCGR_PEP_ID=MMETSP1139-20130426/28121_1 /TAXON_ID=298111 /ORGANISM="Pavlova sp., Strain CCMP459" /LENGTH=251 /DNA_ID=CAMNT_0027742059 /DNA_START=147 /DNA_END=902 /DNA_ORIENTATION=+